MELRRRLQSVGIRTIFCWGDKESEGFWLKQVISDESLVKLGAAQSHRLEGVAACWFVIIIVKLSFPTHTYRYIYIYIYSENGQSCVSKIFVYFSFFFSKLHFIEKEISKIKLYLSDCMVNFVKKRCS
jgi:hypothetical protein